MKVMNFHKFIEEMIDTNWDSEIVFSVVINDIHYQLKFDKVDTASDDKFTFINLKEVVTDD